MPKFKRGQFVRYTNSYSSFNAVVRKIHLDGSITVEVRFQLDPQGKEIGTYHGFPVRIENEMASLYEAA